jgi:hypothetical protein
VNLARPSNDDDRPVDDDVVDVSAAAVVMDCFVGLSYGDVIFLDNFFRSLSIGDQVTSSALSSWVIEI